MTKKDTATGNVLETETYKHDANGNVIEQTVDGITATYTYDRTGSCLDVRRHHDQVHLRSVGPDRQPDGKGRDVQ